MNTSLNEDVEFVALSPWPIQTLVVRVKELSSDFREGLRTRISYEIPEEVDVKSWLDVTERVRDFWDNDEDSVYDNY